MMKRLCAFLTALLLAAAPAARCESAPALTEQGLELSGSSVRYPQITGMADEALQAAVNEALLATGDVENRLNRLSALISDPAALTVDYEATLAGDVLSCVYSAEGAVESSAVTHVYSALNLDLRTGEPIAFAVLFVNETAARARMETILTDEIAPEMSAHLESCDLSPLPETFGLSATGLTLYYPVERFSTLAGRAGSVTLLWSELAPLLRLGEDTVLRRLGAEAMLTLNADSADAIRAAAETGALPGIPAKVGEPMAELVSRYRLLSDPDLYEGGRLVQLEDGAFRGVFLMTDALTERFDASEVQGVRADRLCLYGLRTGQTTQEAWRGALGAPDATVHLDADAAERFRLPAGTSDYYQCGAYRLRLHADETGVLVSVILTP